MIEIEIYYSSVCGLCTKTLDFFRSKNVTFTARAVTWDEQNDEFAASENREKMYKRCGVKIDFVPQIFIGDKYIPGWRKLEPIIESREIDTLLSS